MTGVVVSESRYLTWMSVFHRYRSGETARISGISALSASASSQVRSLRFLSLSSRRPGPKRGSNFWNCTSVAPKLWKLRTMLLLKPLMIETIAITVATPTTIPSTVRNARSLCARTARKAKRTFSPNPRRRWEKMPDITVRREASGVRRGGPRDSGLRLTPHALRLTSFVPQRLHRRQGARLRGGDPAGDDTGERRDPDPDQDEGET